MFVAFWNVDHYSEWNGDVKEKSKTRKLAWISISPTPPQILSLFKYSPPPSNKSIFINQKKIMYYWQVIDNIACWKEQKKSIYYSYVLSLRLNANIVELAISIFFLFVNYCLVFFFIISNHFNYKMYRCVAFSSVS